MPEGPEVRRMAEGLAKRIVGKELVEAEILGGKWLKKEPTGISFIRETLSEGQILIQEDYLKEPWKMMVCCILLNQTNNKQVRPILSSVFELIPNPISTIGCDPERLAAVIKTTGFQNVKASRIIKLSQKWVDGFSDAIELPGIGKYGRDSWEIFINGNLNIEVADKKLDAYLKAINRPSN